ncbi:MAG: ATP-binding protein, partial [Gammaproteobacteria bacterium]|nr:ATP-binding protein [Gammaproteobacteria bacterium]
MTEMQEFADSRSIRLTFHMDKRAVVRGNRVLLSLLIRNVLDNALRYMPPGGSVRLKLECQDRIIVLTISDSGPGI